MLESIYEWFVTFSNEYNLVLLFLLLLLANWPVFVAVSFKFPDDKNELPNAIKIKAIQLFYTSLPVGFILGVAFMKSSEKLLDLVLIPFWTIGFPLGEVLFVSIGFFRLSHRHYE